MFPKIGYPTQAWVFLPKLIILWCLGVPPFKETPILLQINQTKKNNQETTKPFDHFLRPHLTSWAPNVTRLKTVKPVKPEEKIPNLGKTTKKNNETSFFGEFMYQTSFFSGIYVPNFHRWGCFSYTRNSPACNTSDGFFHIVIFIDRFTISTGRLEKLSISKTWDIASIELKLPTVIRPTCLDGIPKPTNGTRLAPRICQVPSRQEIHPIAITNGIQPNRCGSNSSRHWRVSSTSASSANSSEHTWHSSSLFSSELK